MESITTKFVNLQKTKADNPYLKVFNLLFVQVYYYSYTQYYFQYPTP